MAVVVPQLRASDAPINLAPMVDLVFLLLAFFVSVSTFAVIERARPVELPSAAAAGRSERERLVLDVVLEGGAPVLYRAGEAVHPNGLPAGAVVELRAARDLPYARMREVLRSLREAGVTDTSFAVMKESQP